MGGRRVGAFFVLTYVFSIPFWVLAVMLRASSLPDRLPITDIGAVLAPTLAALVLSFRASGWEGVQALLARLVDWSRIARRRWLAVAVLLPVAWCVLAYMAMRGLGFGLSSVWGVSVATVPVLVFFLLGAAAEELGYTAYATDGLQSDHTALTTALVIGPIWALWHVPSMMQLGQSWQLILWGLAATVAIRVVAVWLYNNSSRSTFAVIVSHAVFNTARNAFPGGRDAYQMAHGSISYSVVIVTAVAVVVLWGPRDLATFLRPRGGSDASSKRVAPDA